MQQTLTIDHGAAAPPDIEHGGGGGDHPTSTGIDSRKVLMWTFLGSDCLFFGALIATYMAYRGRNLVPPFPHASYEFHGHLVHGIFDIPYTSISAFVLLMSSLTMVLALASLQRGNVQGMRIWLVATSALGIVFLGGQFYEFTTFYKEGLSLGQSIFGSTFFVLTGFHGAHVTIGVIWLLSIVGASLRGHVRQDNSLMLEISGLYWHFVDIVWIIIFTVVYLVPVPEPH